MECTTCRSTTGPATNTSTTKATCKTTDELRASAAIYGCRGDVPLTLLVRYLTGRLPPPSPHTLSSRAMPWFIPSIVDAFSSAALQEMGTIQYHTIPYHTILYYTILYHTILYDTVTFTVPKWEIHELDRTFFKCIINIYIFVIQVIGKRLHSKKCVGIFYARPPPPPFPWQ